MKSPLRLVLLALGVLVVLAGPSLLRFYTDWLWFGEMGYRQVFRTMIQSQGTLFSLSFIAATIWLIANLNVALFHDIEQTDLDPFCQIWKLIEYEDAAIGARQQPEMDRELIG